MITIFISSGPEAAITREATEASENFVADVCIFKVTYLYFSKLEKKKEKQKKVQFGIL